MKDTFTRLVLFAFKWAQGERSAKLTGVIAGLLPDAISDASRQVMRMLLPLEFTMPDALPLMFERFGLPAYRPELFDYFVQLGRLQTVIATHAISGSVTQMYDELANVIGVQDAGIEKSTAGFWVTTTDVVAAPVVGDTWVLDDDVCIGDSAATVAKTRSVLQMLDYFKPAADFFEGFKEP